MNASDIAVRMIEYASGNRHDVNHFLKVHAYARMMGEREGLDGDALLTLEVAALLHDIACPLCREKYGNTNGKLQEQEGAPLADDFLKRTDLPAKVINRVVFLVSHHHTLTDIDGLDYQILLEADYLVNADESHYSPENIRNTMDKLFQTPTGISLLRSMYSIA